MKKSTTKKKKSTNRKTRKSGKSIRKTMHTKTPPSHSAESLMLLRNLRLQTKEMTLTHSVRLQSDISQMIDDIQGLKEKSKSKKSLDISKSLHRIILIIQNLKLKPEKGRFKDLHKLHDTVKILRRLCNSLEI